MNDQTSLEYRVLNYKKYYFNPIHYGDPPRHHSENQCIGDTMNSEPLRILQFWKRDGGEWERMNEYEIIFENKVKNSNYLA